MKDTSRENERKRRERPGEDESPTELMASYTPQQRSAILKGLRILARVAVRAHMRRQAARHNAEPSDDGGGEEG